ncbi:AI-2E family transporter [soil metagenome]
MPTPALPTARRSNAFARNLLVFTLICVVLFLGRPVLMPLALAVLVTFLLSPIAHRLERWRVPPVPAAVATVTFAAALVGLVGVLMGMQVMSLAHALPSYHQNIVEKIADVKQFSRGGAVSSIQQTIDQVSEDVESMEDFERLEMVGPPTPETISERAKGVEIEPIPVTIAKGSEGTEKKFLGLSVPGDLAPIGEVLATTGLVIILVIFMLLQRKDLRNRLIGLAGRANLPVTTTALNEAGNRIARYLLMQFTINVTYGVAAGIALFFMGVPYAPLWGLSAAVLRYLPYIGPWLAALLPISVSLIMQSGWNQVFLVIGLFIVLELITNNIAEPKLYGHSVGISEVAVIVAAVVWIFLWGPVGLVLATPLTVCVVVLASHVPSLDFIVQLVGERHQLEPSVHFYQRLLSRDEDEAVELFVDKMEESSPLACCDEILIPALFLAQRDRQAGALDDETTAFIAAAVAGLADDIQAAGVDEGLPDRLQPDHPRPILLYPSYGQLDHAMLVVLASLLKGDGYELRTLNDHTLSSDLVAEARESHALAVLLGALAPGSFAHTRRLLKCLHVGCPDVPVLAGRWTAEKLDDSIRNTAKEAGATEVFSTFTAARNHFRNLAMTDRARHDPEADLTEAKPERDAPAPAAKG